MTSESDIWNKNFGGVWRCFSFGALLIMFSAQICKIGLRSTFFPLWLQIIIDTYQWETQKINQTAQFFFYSPAQLSFTKYIPVQSEPRVVFGKRAGLCKHEKVQAGLQKGGR
jgi:hypothetical protein